MTYRGNYGRQYDATLIRKLVTSEIKRSSLSCTQIAEQMGKLLGIQITERMITAFTADSKELHRWPAEFDIAFCEVVGSYRLMSERIKRAGFSMIGPKEERWIALGKAWEQKRRAEQILNGGGQ